MQIDEYLDEATRRPWLYGGGPGGWRGHDCLIYAANWAAALGPDPARGFRGTYSTEKEAAALLDKHGGLFGMMAPPLVSAGWRSVEKPETGTIGIVSVPMGGKAHQFAAIRRERNWIVADPRRLFALPGDLHLHAAWALA